MLRSKLHYFSIFQTHKNVTQQAHNLESTSIKVILIQCKDKSSSQVQICKHDEQNL